MIERINPVYLHQWQQFVLDRLFWYHRFLNCIANGIIDFAGSQAMRFIGNLVLTRLLFPEAFGLMALVHAFIIGFDLISDLGLQPAVIRKKGELSERYLNTAWTLQVIRGVLLFILSFCIALPIADFYDKPEIVWIMPLLGFSRLIASFRSVAVWLVERWQKPGAHTKISLLSSGLGILTSIMMAALTHHVASLVVGTVVWSVIYVAGSFRISVKHKHSFCLDPESRKDLFRFGKWIILSSSFCFLGMQGDRLLIGKLFDAETLGIYTLALFIMQSFTGVVSAVSTKVLIPAFSDESNAKRRGHMHRLFVWGTFPAYCILVNVGDRILEFLYDERYYHAGDLLEYMALAIPPMVLRFVITPHLLANDNSFRKMVLSLFEAGLILGFVCWGGLWGGIHGVIYGYVIGQLCLLIVARVVVHKYEVGEWISDLIYLSLCLFLGYREWTTLTNLLPL